MQLAFDLDRPGPLAQVRVRLGAVFGPQRAQWRLDPLSQMVRSAISGRTYDQTSWAAFVRLRAAFPDWEALADAPPSAVEALIAPVTFADAKARLLPRLMRVLRARGGGRADLSALSDAPVEEAMLWLQGLPGVGVKTAAAVLNFSTLSRRAMVVDSHVLRVSRRLALVPRAADAQGAFEALMAMASTDWDGEALYELHWLMKSLGQALCGEADPACGLCVFDADCRKADVELARARRAAVALFGDKPV